MKNEARKDGFGFPGEFEEQEAVWFSWPVPADEAKRGLSPIPVVTELIRTLVSHVKVKIGAQNKEEKRDIESMLENAGVSLDNVSISIIPHNSLWVRDFGPIYLKNDKGDKIVWRFGFNCWGQSEVDSHGAYLDQRFPDHVARIEKLKLYKTETISEGGDREFNGKGTMITVESVEFQRNPGKTRDALEAEFKKNFNLKTVIWLKKGLYEDDHVFNGSLPGPDGLKDILPVATTNGHVDEHCRFVDPNTVVVAEVTEEEAKAGLIEKENRLRMEENIEILRNSRDQDGNKLNIVRIPAPTPLFSVVTPGDQLYDNYHEQYKNGFIFPIGDAIKVVAAASYNNFLITNGAILMPKYWKPGLPHSIKIKDRKAEEVLQRLFPDRKIYTFDVMALNFGGGGIHCITQQEPRAR